MHRNNRIDGAHSRANPATMAGVRIDNELVHPIKNTLCRANIHARLATSAVWADKIDAHWPTFSERASAAAFLTVSGVKPDRVKNDL